MTPKLPFKIVTYKGKGTQPWRWRIEGLNGEVIASSEGYLTKWNRDRALRNAGFVAGGVRIEEETPSA